MAAHLIYVDAARRRGAPVETERVGFRAARRRYITIFDRAAHDPGALGEIRSIFEPDATVQLHDDQEPVTGIAAIMELCRAFAGGMADSKHFWTTTVLDEGTLECRWVQAARATDGRLLTNSGIERATVTPTG